MKPKKLNNKALEWDQLAKITIVLIVLFIVGYLLFTYGYKFQEGTDEYVQTTTCKSGCKPISEGCPDGQEVIRTSDCKLLIEHCCG